MPRGKMRRNRESPAIWEPSDSAVGAFDVADPSGLAEFVGRAVARRAPGLEWQGGRLVAPSWRRRPSPQVVERERREAQLAAMHTPGSATSLSPWELFLSRYEKSKSELLAEVAKRWGLSYATLHRVVHGKSPSISWRTVRQIRTNLGDSERRKLYQYLFTPGMRAFLEYLKREVARYRSGRTRANDYRYMRSVRREVEAFQGRCQRWGMPPWREELARLRVFDPLVAHTFRRGKFLSQEDTLLLVKRGYRREQLLLTAERRALRGSGAR